MKWIAAQVIFDSDDLVFAKELVANSFHEMGLKGVVVQEPGFEPVADWADEVRTSPEYFAVTGYFPEDSRLRARCRFLENTLARLQEENGIVSRISYSKIDDEDWAESWKAHFAPQRISRKIVVKPSWRRYAPDPEEIVVEIDPGMAFGTGTHPTTEMCIRMIEKYLKRGDTFLDVGTGSGILLIVAAKLGAGKLRGVDIDPHAVEIARTNLLRNRIDSVRFEVAPANFTDGATGSFDLVAANITADVIGGMLDRIPGLLSPGGTLIVSGIIDADEHAMAEKMRSCGLEVFERRGREEWVALAAKLIS
jgi:ribosomal protein L11 methyltransferase